MRHVRVACLLAAGLAACDPPPPPTCFSNDECTAPGEVCDETRNVCIPAPDAGCVPGDELCNGQDDDCDGATDEGFDTGAVCTVSQGACEVSGVQVCAGDGADVACSAEPGVPEPETCNRIDDDCDGATDEGFDTGDACTVGVGACATTGQTICGPDGGTVCNAVPRPSGDESCNAIDDDCDGTVDEGFALDETCTVGVGACTADGFTVCADDGSATCDAEPGEPGVEICNGLDDDCSGIVDEGFGVGADCTVGIGACAAAGSTVCGDDGAAACDAVAGEPGEETCNDTDDDCDGEVDEDFPLGDACVAGAGACAAESIFVCGEDGDAVCPIQPGEPDVETCDGTDEDCDGAVDETFAGQGDPCAEGVGACLTEGVVACVGGAQDCVDAEDAPVLAGQPSDETCNDIDDDCDGGTDEAFPLGEACEEGQGACLAAGIWICGGDGAAECDAEPGVPVDEACNGLDDDCDGEVDDVPPRPCLAGTGECLAEGNLNCVDGEFVCDAVANAAAPEVCNDLDDDCDGRADERLGYPCHPYVLRGGRVTWAAGTSTSADRQWRLEGRGVALDGRTLQDGANRYQLTGGVLKTVGGLEMEGQ